MVFGFPRSLLQGVIYYIQPGCQAAKLQAGFEPPTSAFETALDGAVTRFSTSDLNMCKKSLLNIGHQCDCVFVLAPKYSCVPLVYPHPHYCHTSQFNYSIRVEPVAQVTFVSKNCETRSETYQQLVDVLELGVLLFPSSIVTSLLLWYICCSHKYSHSDLSAKQASLSKEAEFSFTCY